MAQPAFQILVMWRILPPANSTPLMMAQERELRAKLKELGMLTRDARPGQQFQLAVFGIEAWSLLKPRPAGAESRTPRAKPRSIALIPPITPSE